jgi:uncharacterized membrane protein YoaK (UPF0700 family)
MTIFKGLRNKAGLGGPGEAAHEPPPRPARGRDALVVVLTLTTGAVDAVSFLRLGKVFSSVITGNLALLGVATGQHDAMLALNAGLALAGYVCGVLVGGAFAGTPQPGQAAWPVKVTVTLAVEWGALATFSGEWLVTGGHPAGASRLVLLLLGAAAMGMQSTAVRRLGPMSTTYLTSTLTGILTALAVRRWPAEWQRSTGVILAALIGATLGSLAALWSPGWVPAAILVPITAVLAGSAALARPRLPAVSPSLLTAGAQTASCRVRAARRPAVPPTDRTHNGPFRRKLLLPSPASGGTTTPADTCRNTGASNAYIASAAARSRPRLPPPASDPGPASAPNQAGPDHDRCRPRGRSWRRRRFSAPPVTAAPIRRNATCMACYRSVRRRPSLERQKPENDTTGRIDR